MPDNIVNQGDKQVTLQSFFINLHE
jgi:hypothetical protein